MSDKVTLQSVAESFSRACGVPKKVSEQLARAFFETVVDGLSADESVKIDGLGTFRVVEVASRESINVTNGERIVIAGYKKVNFVPEDGMLVSNLIGDMPDVREEVEADVEEETEDVNDSISVGDSADVEEPEADVIDDSEDIAETDEESKVPDAVEAEVNMVTAPEKVEIQEDDFSGIDMLICTPESVEEIRLELEQARADAERKLIAAKEAHREVLRLEALLEKMENGMIPESVESEEENPVVEDAEVTTEEADAVAGEPEVAEPVTEEPVETPAIAEVAAEEVQEEEVLVNEETVVEEPAEEEVQPVSMAAETVANEDVSISVELPEVQVTPEVSEEPKLAPASEVAATEGLANTEQLESPETPEVSEQAVTPSENADGTSSETPTETSDALGRLLADKPTPKEVEKPKKKKDDTNYWVWILIPIVSVLVIGIGIIGFKYHSDQEKQELKQLPVRPKNDAAPAPQRVVPAPKPVADTVSTKAPEAEQKSVKEETVPSASKTVAEPTKASTSAKTKTSVPKTYVLKKGESLTKVSQMFYNTKDSVRAIIRVNKFKDVDNVPYGTEINLP